MTDKTVRVTDPDCIPVRVINRIDTVGHIGGLIDICLSTGRFVEGQKDAEFTVAARLRFDVEMARIIRNALDSQLALMAEPDGKPN